MTFSSDKVAQRMGEYSDANIRFHQTIIGLGNCQLIADITDGLFFHVRAIRQRTIFEADRAKQSVDDHKEIIAALEARDAERSERLVREHTLRTERSRRAIRADRIVPRRPSTVSAEPTPAALRQRKR